MTARPRVARRQRKGAATRTNAADARGTRAAKVRAETAKAAYLVFGQIIDRMPGRKLQSIKTAFEAGRPMTALALIAAEIKPVANDEFVVDKARVRGAKLKEDLLEKAGGLLTSKKAAEILRISLQTLHKRLSKGSLFALRIQGGDLGYPAVQFESELMQAGISAVIRAINVTDAWSILNFLFLRLGELEGRTPVEVIRNGRVGDAARAAKHFGEHGAS